MKDLIRKLRISWHVWLAKSDWDLYRKLKKVGTKSSRRYAVQHLMWHRKRFRKIYRITEQ